MLIKLESVLPAAAARCQCGPPAAAAAAASPRLRSVYFLPPCAAWIHLPPPELRFGPPPEPARSPRSPSSPEELAELFPVAFLLT